MLGGSPPPSGPSAIPVVVRKVSAVDRAQLVVVSGEVEASRTGSVAFQVAGRVARVAVEEGDLVRAGELLAQLDSTDYQLAYTMAAAQTRHAEDQFKRLQQMYEKQGIAPADFVKIETTFEQAQAQQGLARKRVVESRLVAPFGGFVARRGIEVGEQAAPGMPVFTIIATDSVQVRVGVPEAEIGRIRPGQIADIHIPALPGRTFEGRVKLVGVAADPVSRTYTVKVTVANPRAILRPGMIAEARIRQDSRIRAVTIPAAAIVRDAEGATMVYVYVPDERRARSRRVTVGSVYGKEVEVTSGLTGSEMILIGGQHRVREGSLVEAVDPAAPETPVDSRKAP
jgi:RND family efflux transporter MFP subunit